MECHETYLEIKNWNKYQLKMKSGRTRRDWIRIDTNRVDDPDYCRLRIFTRGVLDGIMAYSGRSGRWIRNDPKFISRAIQAIPKEASCIPQAILVLTSLGFLTVCNQQNILESPLQDKTIQYKTVKPPKVPRTPKPLAGYTEVFLSFWNIYPKTNGSKLAAFKAWKKSGLERCGSDIAIESLKLYMECPKWKAGYIQHAATWINGKMWEVEPDMTIRNGGNGNGQRGNEEPDDFQVRFDRAVAQSVRTPLQTQTQRRGDSGHQRIPDKVF